MPQRRRSASRRARRRSAMQTAGARSRSSAASACRSAAAARRSGRGSSRTENRLRILRTDVRMGRRYARGAALATAAAPSGSCMIPRVRLVTWNVAGRVRRQPEQAAVIAALSADVVALQEVTARTLPLWRAALAEAGLPFAETALDEPDEAPRPRPLGVLTAARAAGRPLAGAGAVLPDRRRRGDRRALPDRARARARQGPDPRGRRGPPRGDAAQPAHPVRRPQHAAARAARRRGADVRPRQRGPAPARARGALGRRRARARPRPPPQRLDGRLPGPARLRRALRELDVRARPRRVAARPPPRARARAPRLRLRPRLAPRRPQRPLGADRRPGPGLDG